MQNLTYLTSLLCVFLLVFVVPFCREFVVPAYIEIEECKRSLEYLSKINGSSLMIKNALNEAIGKCESIGSNESDGTTYVWYGNLKLIKDQSGKDLTEEEVSQIKELAGLAREYL